MVVMGCMGGVQGPPGSCSLPRPFLATVGACRLHHHQPCPRQGTNQTRRPPPGRRRVFQVEGS
jgi:hypothetical protein